MPTIRFRSTKCQNFGPISITRPSGDVALPPCVLIGSNLHYAIPASAIRGKLRTECTYVQLAHLRQIAVKQARALDPNATTEQIRQAVNERIRYTTEQIEWHGAGFYDGSNTDKINPVETAREYLKRPVPDIFGGFTPVQRTSKLIMTDAQAIEAIPRADNGAYRFQSHPVARGLASTRLPDDFVSDPETTVDREMAAHVYGKFKKEIKDYKELVKKAKEAKLPPPPASDNPENRDDKPRAVVSARQIQESTPHIPGGTAFKHLFTLHGVTPAQAGLVMAGLDRIGKYNPWIGGNKARGHGGAIHAIYEVLVEQDGEWVKDCEITLVSGAHDPTKPEAMSEGGCQITSDMGGVLASCIAAWNAITPDDIDLSIPFIPKEKPSRKDTQIMDEKSPDQESSDFPAIDPTPTKVAGAQATLPVTAPDAVRRPTRTRTAK